jgi:FkbH-like protein
MENLTYADILAKNRELGAQLDGAPYRVLVLSNIVVVQLKEILEFDLRSRGVNATVTLGDYDNILQGSAAAGEYQAVVVFWEPANFVDGLHYRADTLSPDELEALGGKVDAEIATVLANLSGSALVVFNTFSTLAFTAHELGPTPFSALAARANRRLRAAARPGLISVDVDALVAKTGLAASFDFRLFQSSRALYTTSFFCGWAEHARPAFLSGAGKAKKALVLDCDNTLWKGVVGEDGIDGIDLSPESPAGKPYAEVQALVLRLQKQGVLIGLCTKNNPGDVDEVLRKHPDMLLRDEHLAGRRVNWDDKAANLRALAEEWNIGLDSIVYVDDSDFELGLIRQALPAVTTLRVPAQASAYPQLLRRHLGLFFQLSVSAEDAAKTVLYRQERERVGAQRAYADIEDYLRSLQLTLTLYERPASLAARLAQMTQKTNQFNLTTRRYTETDIRRFLESDRHLVLAMRVSDRFGDYGVTGEAIVELDPQAQAARIDTLLMSCRVLGRNVEFAFADELVRSLAARGMRRIEAEYLKTAKNDPIAGYLDQAGFELVQATADARRYRAIPQHYRGTKIDYVTIQRSPDDVRASAKA